MKSSPLQLKWVAYPAVSFRALPSDISEERSAIKLSAEVRYELDGDHMVNIQIDSTDQPDRSFDFSLEAIAIFQVDLDAAREAYKGSPLRMPVSIAVNVVRLLYSSAREMLSMYSSRSPIGPILVESILIEPKDVAIRSNAKPEDILREVFKVDTEAELAKVALPNSSKQKRKAAPKKKA